MPTLRQRPPKKGDSNTPSLKSSSPSTTTSPPSSLSTSKMCEPNTLTPLLHAKTNPEALSGRHVHPSSQPEQRVLEQEYLEQENTVEMENLSRKSQWIVLALASGGCAAFNGVFAKLTTTELTTSFATWIADAIGLGGVEGGVEVVVRAIFFGLNLIFNGIMWTLFTKALARGTSTTQVSILNTSANFMFTAVMGWLIFSESLPPMWFLGASLLVAGNVIIGRRDEGEDKDKDVVGSAERRSIDRDGNGLEGESLLGEEVELDAEFREGESVEERKRREGEEDVLQLD
ncbi:hypothetical protein ONS95_014495 [Cadophora gregata]|uniref:uncharacterized protein n=1 Tax=Cadophora gregata TaxID=51156 RepID=UPI0026DDC775|nr:uncharacterized protein ONS95_014495 [Cadophora gregata]KAK0112761.1 hypothetical protein ONS95_014495 [Cadophora gregata]KAK0124893.1 hypothetical protein ONS96_008771 [Cadophora gregata f. sp. sojae]